MSCPEFITHPKRSTDFFNKTQAAQISYQNTHKKKSVKNPAQQKQRKQLLLTESKNTFTYRFQPIQRSQPNFVTNSRRTFIHTNYNENNPKVRTFKSQTLTMNVAQDIKILSMSL